MTLNLFYLIGFMGTGKSSVGISLANYLGYSYLDMDKMIEDKQKCTINDIFANQGEPVFRQIESELLSHLSETRKKSIISTGGGVILREHNIAVMRESGAIILLTAEPETIIERLAGDHSRPLLQGDDKVAKVTALLGSRKEKYMQAADVIVKTDDRSIDNIVSEVIEKLKEKIPKMC